MAAVIGMVVNIGGNLFTVPRWGINGAAVASAVSYSLTLIFLLCVFKKMGGDKNNKRKIYS